jgi:hypothetical protein
MPTRNLLAEKNHLLDQRMAKIKEQKAKLQSAERRSRTQRLIVLGGLIAKAGLEELDKNELYGALLDIKALALNEDTLKKWAKKGGEAFFNETKNKTPVIVKFISPPPTEIKLKLREHNLKWNHVLKLWSGYVDFESLKAALENTEADIKEAIQAE